MSVKNWHRRQTAGRYTNGNGTSTFQYLKRREHMKVALSHYFLSSRSKTNLRNDLLQGEIERTKWRSWDAENVRRFVSFRILCSQQMD